MAGGEAVGVGGVDLVAGVDLTQADAAGCGRGDARVAQLQFGVVDHAAIVLDGALILPDESLLGVELLLGDGILGPEIAVARQVEAGVVQLGRVARQLAVGLRQLRLERRRVDFRQQLSRLHRLSFGEMHPEQQAIDARADCHQIARHGAADGRQPDRHILDRHFGNRDRLWSAGAEAPAARPRGAWRLRGAGIGPAKEVHAGRGAGQRQEEQEGTPRMAAQRTRQTGEGRKNGHGGGNSGKLYQE